MTMNRIELELVSDQVLLIKNCLRFRAMELEDHRKNMYNQLADNMKAVGLYVFLPFDAMSICIAIREYNDTIKQLFGDIAVSRDARDLAEVFFYAIFHQEMTSETLGHINQAVNDTGKQPISMSRSTLPLSHYHIGEDELHEQFNSSSY